MYEYNNYIDSIIKNLDSINKSDLKIQILRLIEERNHLLEIVKKDTLTGAYNRRILNYINNFSVVVLCDVDDFKCINDTYGHDVGDNVLKVVTKILMNNTRENDIVCRYGGDEFLVIFNKCSKDLVKKRMNIISKIINDCFRNLNINVSFSAGISSYEVGKTLDEIIKEADIALYESKNNGKNGISVYNKNNKVYQKNNSKSFL